MVNGFQMAMRALRTLVMSMVVLALVVSCVTAQPYYFYWSDLPSSPSDEDAPRQPMSFLTRYNFRTAIEETLMVDIYGLQYMFVSGDQQRVFLGFGDRYGARSVYSYDANNPAQSARLVVRTDWTVHYIAEAPLVNRLYLHVWDPMKNWDEPEYVLVLDRTSFARIDSTMSFARAFADRNWNYFFSRDQRKAYNWTFNQAGFFFDTYSALDGSPLSQTRIGSVTNIPYGPGLEAGKNGYAVVGFGYQPPKAHGFETQVYAFCDVDAGTIMAEVPFPWRAEVTLSGDGRKAIVEETPVSGRTGHYWVFDMLTGRLLQRFSVPVRGMMHVFETHPDEIFYVTQEQQPAQRIDLTMETPTSELFDTLASQLPAAFVHGWVGEGQFTNELRQHLTNASRMLENGNASGGAAQLETFRKQVKSAFDAGTKPGDKRWVTMDGYKALYFNAGYVVDRLRMAKE